MQSRFSRRLFLFSCCFGIFISSGVLGLTGCSNLEPVAVYQQETDPAQLYMRLRIDHRAINVSTVAPYDTLQLTATPFNANGEPMIGLPMPTFHLDSATLGDTLNMRITPTGLLKALAATSGNSGRKIIAELAIPGNIRHADTVFVKVINTSPQTLSSVVFDGSPDSTMAGLTIQVNAFARALSLVFPYWVNPAIGAPRALDDQGNVMNPRLLFDYTSLDSTIIDRIAASGATRVALRNLIRPGQVGLVARTTAYGVAMADTVFLTVTWPAAQFVVIEPSIAGGAPEFRFKDIRLAPNGIVYWQNHTADTVDITFDDPTDVGMPNPLICGLYADTAIYGPGPHCGTGNALAPGVPVINGAEAPSRTDQVRQFPVPGIYYYSSARTGAMGRIIVTSDPDPSVVPWH